MRLLRQTSREYKSKNDEVRKYDKFWIIVPNKLIEKLKWKEGEDLEAEVKKGKLVIEKD